MTAAPSTQNSRTGVCTTVRQARSGAKVHAHGITGLEVTELEHPSRRMARLFGQQGIQGLEVTELEPEVIEAEPMAQEGDESALFATRASDADDPAAVRVVVLHAGQRLHGLQLATYSDGTARALMLGAPGQRRVWHVSQRNVSPLQVAA